MKKNKSKLPKFIDGGELLNKTGQFYKNAGLGTADAAMSMIGMNNVIKDTDYSGAGAQFGKDYSNIVGSVGKTALPMAMNMMLPGSGQLISAGQQIAGQYNPQTTMRMGGIMQYTNGGMPNAEVEKQENTLNPDGSTNQYDGPSHEEGGIKTHLDPSTLVFSDKLKLNGKTFADLNKPNMTNKEDKILDTTKSPIERLTAELMKTAKNKNSEKLFEEQEALKQSKLSKYAKRIGLSLDNKYLNGGKTPQQWDQEMSAKGWQVDPRANYDKNYPGFKTYIDPAYKFIQDPTSTSGWKAQGPNLDAFGTIPGTAVQSYQPPIKTSNVEFKSEKPWIPMGTTNVNGQTAGYFRKGNDNSNDRYTYQGGQYVKMKNGGLMKFGDGDEMPPILPDHSNSPAEYIDNSLSPEQAAAFNQSLLKGLTDPNTPPTPDSSSTSNNIPWGNIAKQIGLGAANNMGNIYDLNRAKDTEVTKFERATPSLLDPTAALQYNDMQGRRYAEELKNSSVGNSSTYIQNRKDAAINQMMSNAQIRQNYANQNAGIKNNMSMFNTGIGNQEVIANEQNRAAGRNIKSNAYANIGQNIMGQYKDIKLDNRDQDVLNMFRFIYGQMYPFKFK